MIKVPKITIRGQLVLFACLLGAKLVTSQTCPLTGDASWATWVPVDTALDPVPLQLASKQLQDYLLSLELTDPSLKCPWVDGATAVQAACFMPGSEANPKYAVSFSYAIDCSYTDMDTQTIDTQTIEGSLEGEVGGVETPAIEVGPAEPVIAAQGP